MKKSKTSFSANVRSELEAQRGSLDPKRTFVQQCFIEGGTLSDPNRSYHLEFNLNAADAAQLLSILRGYDLHPKRLMRRGNGVVYIKDAAEIAHVLNIISAHKTLLAFENIRVEKDLRNNLNRKVNFETANLNKTIGAAMAHIEAIRYIEERGGFGLLAEPLEKAARLRVQYEDASLEEIGAMLTPPIGKSGVNHRLRKIYEIAEQLKGEDNID
jgi:hypothetical protein